MMDKITAAHLERTAYVYVRQSTADQLANNPESRRRQYALEPRARSLGWQDVVVIDDDLGRSGGGIVRPGFDRLLSAICSGSVGAVLAIEVSRLARNGRDWHTLIEFCALVGSLILDEDGVYDPRSINDRLLLGMKGTFSELELSLLRQRSLEALRLKAGRGDLHTTVAIGYLRSADDRIEMDPDHRIREALTLVFSRFEEAGSIRQVTLSLQQDRIDLPHLVNGPNGRIVEWRPARYTRVYHVLTNPVYAGAYAFGRTSFTAKVQNGRKVIKSRDLRRPEQWKILITKHHEGYISWDQYERNQRAIASNASMRGATVQGAARNGNAVLVGLLRCGHCGRKLKVQYSGGGRVGRYTCSDQVSNRVAVTTCISFGSMRIDTAVSAEVLRLLSPLALDAALEAIDDRQQKSTALLGQTELMLQQAQYEADRARRQYDAIDPENRLVAGELERRWNERLENVARFEKQLQARCAEIAPALDPTERTELLALATDLPRLWNHPAASMSTRKRLLRTLLEDIVVCVEPGRLLLKLHWKGGDHTALEVPKNRWGQHRWKTSDVTVELIRDLARLLPDERIASLLNRLGVRSAKGNTWTLLRVRSFRCQHQIGVYRDGERAERGEMILKEAAAFLGVSKMTVIRLIKSEVLPARQPCAGAPYVIRQHDLEAPAVQRALEGGRIAREPRQIAMEGVV
jgi:excisionase family DNA binding protein